MISIKRGLYLYAREQLPEKKTMSALSINDLHKTYATDSGGYHALKGIALQVTEGDFFGLLGPNGAGKTTTIGIVTSLVTKSCGSVKIFGIDIDTDFPAAKRMLGVVPQEFNFNIFEKVQDIVIQQAGYYGIKRAQAEANSEKYLRQLGLWEKRKSRAQELSGGMKRRLMIARGLVHEPKLLILDEPSAGVDVELRRGMWDFLQNLNKEGRTIILTTHYLEEAEQLCNKIAIINKGMVIENTSKRELLKKLDHETLIFESREKVAARPSLPGVGFTLLDETTVEIRKPCALSLNEIFNQLDKYGITVDSMRNKSNRLEELFIKLVEE